MSEEIDPAVLKATKDALGKYVKKPPLSDKLLSKPPFKFLHDVFSVVIKDHGLMEGLFTPAEMKSDSFKDKESKVAYIQKVIDVMEFVNGEKLAIKPGKVVAGAEASKTNMLLQSVGKALSSKANSADAVKKVLAGEKFSGGKKKKKGKDGDSPKKAKGGASLSDATNKSPDKKGKKDKDDKKKKKDDGDEKTGKKGKDGEKAKKKKGDKGEDGDEKGKKKKEGKKKKKKIPKFEDIMADVPTAGSEAAVEAQPELQMEAKETTGEEEGDITMDTTVPLSDGGTGFSAPRPRTARSARPSSARPAAPRPKARAVIEQQLEEAASGTIAAAAPAVMFDEDDDDDDHFVVEEKRAAPDPGLAAMMQDDENLAEQAETGEHGLLVSQILETKKSMEEELKGKTQIERDSGADKGKSRDKDAVRREVARLRESIQRVTKSANPLGKMMDFLQEDVDSMQRELDKWRDENKQMTQQIRSEMDATNSSIEPLKAALAEYEQSIQDQLDKISAVRASNLQNEDKIYKLMAGVMNVAATAP